MKKFYEVEKPTGAIIRYDLAKQDYYYSTTITKCSDDFHRIVDDSVPTKIRGCRRWLTKETIEDCIERGTFFLNLEDAMAKSEGLWNEYFGPDDKWCVIGVFDNVEITYKSLPMSRKEAESELSRCVNSCYTKYSLVKAR